MTPFKETSPEINQPNPENSSSLSPEELQKWKELYPTIDVQKVLEKIKELNNLEFQFAEDAWQKNKETGEFEPWEGKTSFSGIKRFAMMLFDTEKENSDIFYESSDEVKDEILKFNMDNYLKK